MKGDEIYSWGIDVLTYYPEQKETILNIILISLKIKIRTMITKPTYY